MFALLRTTISLEFLGACSVLRVLLIIKGNLLLKCGIFGACSPRIGKFEGGAGNATLEVVSGLSLSGI